MERAVQDKFTDLRKRAQALLSESKDEAASMAPEEFRKMIHELDTYQIELELQNEDLRETQRELECSRRRYSDLYDFAPVGYLTISDKGLIVESNLTAAEMLGAGRASLIGQPFSAFIEPGYQDSYYQHLRLLLEAGTQQPCELQILQKEGSPLFVQLQSIVMPEMDGVLGQFRTCLTDISRRRELEEALRQSTEWGKTFDAMPDVVTIQDAEMRIVRANKAAHQFFQVPYGKLIGKRCYELLRGKREPCLGCPLYRSLHDRENHSAIIRYEPLNKILQVSSSIMSADNGDIQYLIHVAKDISEQKKLEEDLFQAHKMEAIGALASGIAHDFNNILFAIIGSAELIEREVPAESYIGKNIAQILASGKRAADLVRQILTFSRKTGRVSQPLSPYVCVKEALKMLRVTLPESITIDSNIESDCGVILGDPSSIHQIVVNLCTNGMHAIGDNKGVLKVTLGRMEQRVAEMKGKKLVPPGSYVVLTVQDSGCGMDTTTMDRIFEPYFTTKELKGGTGLGLAVVHSAVRNCNGFINVESVVGEGSTFTVYLPVIEEPEISSAISELEGRAEALTGTERILVVDDEPLLVKINEKRLGQKGYQVTGVTGSRKALEMFRSRPDSFDLLITDQTMPRLKGVELAEEVLKIKPSMLIILCTGHSETFIKEEALAIGIKKYVFKPVHNDELLVAVREVLSENRS